MNKQLMQTIAICLLAFFCALEVVAQQPPPGPPGTRIIGPGDGSGSVLSEEAQKRFAEANPEDITSENFPELIESFDYPNADIAEVITAISKLTGKNFIVDPQVRGKITIIAPTQITVAEAYKAFLSALAINGFTVVPSGSFLKIKSARNAQRDSIETYSGAYYPDSDQMITRIIKLRYINAEEVNKQLRILPSKDGEMVPYPPTNSIIISDYGSNIDRVMKIINQLDVPGFEEQLEVIRIKHAKAKDISDLVEKIINKGEKDTGRAVPRFRRSQQESETSGSGAESFSLVLPDDRTNSIIVVGNKAGIDKIRRLINKLDFPLRPEDSGGVHVYYVRHADAEEIANTLNGIASDVKAQREEEEQEGAAPAGLRRSRTSTPSSQESGESSAAAVFGGDVKVTADKNTNSLIITASKQDYGIVKDILAKIDIPRDQVFVKTVILEMSAEKQSNWGINYYAFDSDSNGIGRIGFRGSSNLSDLLNPASDSGAIIGFGQGDEVELEFGNIKATVTSVVGMIKFLKQNVGANVLSTPQIMVLDNEEGEIEVGQTIPVAPTTSTTGSTVTSTIQREKATIKLNITPSISPDTNSVKMIIDQQIKQLSSKKVEASELAEAAVVTNDRNLKTSIVVDSGDTAVLGGLMSDQESEDVIKVPILGDIPIIGWLFKSRNVSNTKTNLVVFITPKIIRSTADAADIVDEKLDQRIKFIQRNLNGRDPHGEAVDQLPRGSRLSTTDFEEKSDFESFDEFESQEEPAVESF